ncbi:MAG: gamma carbonic anhydrase family protein [Gemmatimonadetes bacterium]|nr:gamma carbonic anhydrase family protein [Gemmatimonadota bacterium]
MAVPTGETVIDIHPTAFIAPGAVVVGEVTLGAHASVWYGCVLRGDMDRIVVAASSNIQDGSIVHVDGGEPALIGARVGVGHRAVLHGCVVEDDCLIGMGSVLLNGVRIGTGSVVAAGAVVPEGMQVPPGSLVMGVPARLVRPVDAGLRARIRETWEHYVEEAERHRAGRFPAAPSTR